MALTVSSFIPTDASVRTRAADQLSFTFNAIPQAMSLYVRFIEHGSVKIASSRVLQIGDASNARLLILTDSSPGVYRVQYQNGTGAAAVQSAMAVGPSLRDQVELLATLTAAGIVQLHQSINRATMTSGIASTALVLPLTWGASTIWANSVSTTGVGFIVLLNWLVMRGVQDFATMRRIAGVS